MQAAGRRREVDPVTVTAASDGVNKSVNLTLIVN